MKKIINLVVLISFALLINGNAAFANHIYGGDISYTYVSKNLYKVTALVYQDCNGTKDPATDLKANNVPLGATKCCAKDVTPMAKGGCDRCMDPTCSFGFGITQWTIYASADVTYASDCEVVFSYQDCCDKNIQNFYIEAIVNNCYNGQNGPVYKEGPITITCINSAIDRFQSAIAANKNDSIVYSLTSPMSGPGSWLSYPSPYTYQTPVSYTGTDPDATFKLPLGAGFHYNQATGRLQFRPTKVEGSYFAMKVDEYRKDSTGKYYRAGTTMRRVYMNIINCDYSSPPYLLRTSGGYSDSFYVCANIPLSINFKALSLIKGDTVQTTADNETNGTFTINYPRLASSYSQPANITFAWTPKNSDISSHPHAITVTASDGSKPIPNIIEKRVYIFVKDSFPITEVNTVDSGCGKYHFSLTKPIDKSIKMTYQWLADSIPVSTKDNFSFHTTQAGRHVITLFLSKTGSCTRTYSDTIWFDSAYHKLSPVIGFCKGASALLTTINQKNLAWSPGKGLSDSTIYNPIATPITTTTYTVTGKDKSGCVFTDQTKINVSDFTIKTSGDKHVCPTYNIIIARSIPGATTTWTTTPVAYNIPAKDSAFVLVPTTTTFHATVNYLGCIKQDSFTYFTPDSATITSGKKVCEGDDITLHTTGGNGYAWVDMSNYSILGTKADYTISKAKNISDGYRIQLQMQDPATGCTRYGKAFIKVIPFSPAVSNKNPAICHGDSVKFLASGGNRYQWTQNGNILSDKARFDALPLSSTKYNVNITDTITGCKRIETATVYQTPSSHAYPPLAVCHGNTVTLGGKEGSSYLWSPVTGLSDPKSASPKLTPVTTSTYTVAIKDSATGCTHTDTLEVFVDYDCMWPGDANKDNIADYLDVLNIGVAYGAKGPVRNPSHTDWQASGSLDWKQTTATGANYKHIDCNGDGVIDAKDTIVIGTNYGNRHLKWAIGTGGDTAKPHIYFKFDKDTFYAGETATAYLYAGDSKHPLKNAYGIGFEARFAAQPLVSKSAAYFPVCDYFCAGSQLNYFRPDYVNNATDAAIVQTDGRPSQNSTGRFAGVSFQLKDSLSFHYPDKGTTIEASLIAATVIDSAGKEIEVYGASGTAMVFKKKSKTGTGLRPDNNLLNEIHIYPNPANSELTIETGNVVPEQIILQNMLGENVALLSLPLHEKNILDVSKLSPGFYLLSIKTSNSTAMQKVLITR